ncbi:hypothetical protein pclt_cds_631 [Pandoravirus celtis]|uniref:Uncharacterized protein n=1 Tax=Pandoravirus celtis TaxID=2568002 RepID=A0A4D6EHQ0_9VIRU|nr:hypothetical protein pclt_cds_631 [Pandoravirus celtis]
MSCKRRGQSLTSRRQRPRHQCPWTDDLRAHVVWALVVASMAKKGKEVAAGDGPHQAIVPSVVDALCALAQTCSVTRTAVQDATIFVEALFATDDLPDDAWSHPDDRAVERRPGIVAGGDHYPIDYSSRGRLLARRTTLGRKNGGYAHVTFKNLPKCDQTIYVLFCGYLGSEPGYFRFTVDADVAECIINGTQDEWWLGGGDDDDDGETVTFAVDGTRTRWAMRGYALLTQRGLFAAYSDRLHIHYIDVWCYVVGPD